MTIGGIPVKIASFTGPAYLGIVSLVSAAGEYSEIDNNFSLVML